VGDAALAHRTAGQRIVDRFDTLVDIRAGCSIAGGPAEIAFVRCTYIDYEYSLGFTYYFPTRTFYSPAVLRAARCSSS
jgi:hypothetical protein